MVVAFEVTILMIPARAVDDTKEEEKVEAKDVEETGLKKIGGEALEFAKGQVKDAVTNFISNSPVGVFVDLINIGKDPVQIFDEKNPGEKLKLMKTTLDENDMRIYSDLEVMFQGMAYIVGAALDCIKDAVTVLQRMQEIGSPEWFWVCMPWKTQEVLALKEELAGHREALSKQVVTLQTAIGVASYAVQLEQMERYLIFRIKLILKFA